MKENKNFDEKALKIREICKNFVKNSMKSQIESYIRWGVMHDYRYSYMSLNNNYEASVLESFATLMSKNLVYVGQRPVFWSAREQRILAEEELETRSKYAPSHLVKFKIKKFGELSKTLENLGTIHLLTFVNEPWKLTSTQALAIHPEQRYSLVKDSNKNYMIIALDRKGELSTRLERSDIETDLVAPGKALLDLELEHPLFPHISVSVVPDKSVSCDYGTGINPICPLSSLHDLELADTFNLPSESFISQDGKFTNDLGPELDNLNPFTQGNDVVVELLTKNNKLLLSYEYEHTYTRIKDSKERVLLTSLDAWFFRISDSLRQK
jgi:isoleucyl-tRNA synthetase